MDIDLHERKPSNTEEREDKQRGMEGEREEEAGERVEERETESEKKDTFPGGGAGTSSIKLQIYLSKGIILVAHWER
jgi:hypothetical protein